MVHELLFGALSVTLEPFASSELRSMSSLMHHIASSWISLEALKLTVCVVKINTFFVKIVVSPANPISQNLKFSCLISFHQYKLLNVLVKIERNHFSREFSPQTRFLESVWLVLNHFRPNFWSAGDPGIHILSCLYMYIQMIYVYIARHP